MCDDDEVRHRTRLVDGAQVAIEIPLMAAADDLAAVADEERVPIAPLLSTGDLNTEGAFPAMLGRFRDVELRREILEVSSCLLIDHELEVQAKRIDAGPAAQRAFRMTGPHEVLVSRAGGDERNAAILFLHIARLTRQLKIGAGARRDDARGFHVLFCRQKPLAPKSKLWL